MMEIWNAKKQYWSINAGFWDKQHDCTVDKNYMQEKFRYIH